MQGISIGLLAVAIMASAVAVSAQEQPAKTAPLAGSDSLVTSKISIYEADARLERGSLRVADKGCCGYPLSEPLGFALRFYWLAIEDRYFGDPVDTDIYSPDGLPLGSYPYKFVRALHMEGSGLLSDGRVFNYAGKCKFGYGTCFENLDIAEYPFGRGAGKRKLVPFKSVAVDRRLIKLGEPLYFPELDGLPLPDGTIHDGCVRADDVGGNIKERKIDFFVIRWEFFRMLLGNLYGVTYITPHVESPHCQYLREDR